MAKSRKSVSKADDVSEPGQESIGKEPEIAPDANPEAKSTEDTGPESPATDPDLLKDAGAPLSPVVPDADKSGDDKPGEAASFDTADEDKAQSADAVSVEAAQSDKTSDPVDRENEKTEAEQDSASLVPVPAAAKEPRRSVFWPLVFGGLVAACLGFIAGRGDQLEPYLPASMQRVEPDLSQLEDRIATLTEANDAQTSQIEALQSRPDAPDPSGEIATLADTLADLEARLADLESRPVVVAPPVDGTDSEDVAALQEAVSGQQATLDAQRAEIAALAEQADAAEARARSEAADLLARAALTRVVTAVETGDSFTPALSDLEEMAAVEIPEALRTAAETGVPTIASLRESFPGAARAGLAAARAEVPEAEVEGLGGFLRRQLGARSVTPREGSDPDAILSRAEAALRLGDLAAALTEMEALPEASRTAMQDWLEPAAARQAAEDAADALADSLKSN